MRVVCWLLRSSPHLLPSFMHACMPARFRAYFLLACALSKHCLLTDFLCCLPALSCSASGCSSASQPSLFVSSLSRHLSSWHARPWEGRLISVLHDHILERASRRSIDIVVVRDHIIERPSRRWREHELRSAKSTRCECELCPLEGGRGQQFCSISSIHSLHH